MEDHDLMSTPTTHKTGEESGGVRSRDASLVVKVASWLISPETTYTVWEKLFWLWQVACRSGAGVFLPALLLESAHRGRLGS